MNAHDENIADPTKEKKQIFLSYAYADRALAYRIAEALRDVGLNVWDGSRINFGQSIVDEVELALQKSQAMVVLLTPQSNQSINWQREVQIGHALGEKAYAHRLFPVIASPSGQLPSDQIPWVLRSIAFASLPEKEQTEDGLHRLAEMIGRALQSSGDSR